MTDTQAPEPTPGPNVHDSAASGLDPTVGVGAGDPPTIEEGTDGTRDGTVDDVRPLGVSEDQTLDPDQGDEEDSSGTDDGTVDPDTGDSTDGQESGGEDVQSSITDDDARDPSGFAGE